MSKHSEIAEKTERLQQMLRQQNLGGVIINSQPNFSWLSAGGSNGIDLTRDSGTAALFVRDDGKKYLLSNRIEIDRLLTEEVSAEEFEPIDFPWEEEKTAADFLVTRARALLTNQKELASDLPLGNSCKTVEGDLTRCRAQLTADEVERFRLLGQDAGTAIGCLVRSLQPGQTEKEIARKTVDALAAKDAYTVVVLIAADERIARFRHPVPTNLSWKRAFMLVVCARRSGLVASLTRIVCAGSVPDELRLKTIATAKVNADLFAATQPGVTGAELYSVAGKSYAAAGFPGEEQLHHQGGACGYRTRDWVAHPKSSEKVVSNQAFAWNPSITGTKVEETVIAFEDRIETITSSPDWPQIIVNSNGRDYSLPDVLAL